MSFDGLMMYHLIREYMPNLIQSKVEGIYFEHPDRFIFHLYKGKKFQFIIDLNAQGNRLYYEDERIKPKANHPFLNVLKKHITQASLKQLRQHQTDRVLIFDLETYDAFDGKKDYVLIFEAMGKHANLILTQNNIIIGAYKTMVSTSHRSIFQGLKFQFFPSNKTPFTTMDTPSDDAKSIQNTYEGISPDTSLYLASTFQKALDINPKPSRYQHQMLIYSKDNATSYQSMNDMMKDNNNKPLSFTQETQIIEKALAKKQQKLGFLTFDLNKYEQDTHLKNDADTLLSYPHQYQYASNIDHIILDPSKTVNENALDLYKAYKKAKRAIDVIHSQIDMTKAEIELLQQTLFDIHQHAIQHHDLRQLMIELNLIKPHKHTEKQPKIMHHHIKHQAYDIFYGTNAMQNNYVTHQLAKKDDYFIHVKDAPGAHVIYRGQAHDEGFLLALKIAAYHSKLRFSSSIPVNYTLKKHVKKIPGLFGSYVTLTTYQTKYIDLEDDFVNMWDIM